ncbi:NB-ARC domain-containing protein [Cryptosporangium japonicum]|uniref:NB-ARC domain-containing protein n=1 Tax=Cryptosporangium japonicum TaxID=80872 RepID=UPI0031DBAC98
MGPDFAGRQDTVLLLDRLALGAARPASPAVVLLSGVAGTGKTALALHWAHRVADQFVDGHLYADLRGFHPSKSVRSALEVLTSFLVALGWPPHLVPNGLDAVAALYRSLVADRRLLIVLDDARDATQVRPLLPGGSRSVVLVTSRLQLTGLVAAEAARRVPVGQLDVGEARELLSRRLGSSRIAAEPEAVDRIIARCGRLPLALALFAARAAAHPTFSLTALADELDESPNPLDGLHSEDAATDLRTALGRSLRALSPDAASLFVRLGTADDGHLTVPEISDLTGLPRRRVGELLRELVLANLLSEQAPGRFALDYLLQAYAIAVDEERLTRAVGG